MEPTRILPNGDLYYEAGEGKILLQVDTGRKYKKALDPHDGRKHRYEEIDEEPLAESAGEEAL